MCKPCALPSKSLAYHVRISAVTVIPSMLAYQSRNNRNTHTKGGNKKRLAAYFRLTFRITKHNPRALLHASVGESCPPVTFKKKHLKKEKWRLAFFRAETETVTFSRALIVFTPLFFFSHFALSLKAKLRRRRHQTC